MTCIIPLNLAVEDPLSEAVLREIAKQSSQHFSIGTAYSQGGYQYLKKKIGGFNNAAKGTPFLVLADLDMAECAPLLIKDWLPHPKEHNLIFRVAVREVEAWLLAHSKAFARFLGIRETLIPIDVESINDPKQFLIKLAGNSTKQTLRESIVPIPQSTAKVGPDYNGKLILFVRKYWKAKLAMKNSLSLEKTVIALEKFKPKFKNKEYRA
jgi:hypothetical protein